MFICKTGGGYRKKSGVFVWISLHLSYCRPRRLKGRRWETAIWQPPHSAESVLERQSRINQKVTHPVLQTGFTFKYKNAIGAVVAQILDFLFE